jgi:lysine 2,3-aminomutase
VAGAVTLHPDRTLRSIDDLLAAGLVSSGTARALAPVAARYAVAITPAMAALISTDDATDPIARQFVPAVRELDHLPTETADAIGDDLKSPVPGIVHRYPDRVLLKVTGVCPVYCRFCFRREMVGPDAGRELSKADLVRAFDYIRATPQIWEVILTGGDPFILSASRISGITAALAKIPHVKIIRWHTRVPVVAPGRITQDFVAALKSGAQSVFVGLHANHPRELTPDARAAIGRLVDAGIPVVSQTVLLKGVNDDAVTLEALMRAFVEARVKPYYLHHGDLAPGTSHFRTTIAHGQDLMRQLRQRLSGLALPTYVLDGPAATGKVPIEGGYVTVLNGESGYVIAAANGTASTYHDCCEPP